MAASRARDRCPRSVVTGGGTGTGWGEHVWRAIGEYLVHNHGECDHHQRVLVNVPPRGPRDRSLGQDGLPGQTGRSRPFDNQGQNQL